MSAAVTLAAASTVLTGPSATAVAVPAHASVAATPSAARTAAGWPHLVSSATPAPGSYGYWDVFQDGTVVARNGAPYFGDASSLHLAAPIVGIVGTPTGKGYWLVAADGGVFTYGDARFLGSAGNLPLRKPIVGMATTGDGGGYWLVASDGGLFAYGDATFYGSMGGVQLTQPVVGMAATPDGHGYWMVAADGGIFAFGDAPYEGSMGGRQLAAPIVGMAAGPSGNGYWLIGSDGGIFSFNVPFYGSAVGKAQVPTSGIIDSNVGGYIVVLTNGSVLPYPGLYVNETDYPTAYTGQPYSVAIQYGGGEAPYNWSLVGGSFPPGVSITPSGVVQGTPTASGTYSFNLQLTDGLGEVLSYSGGIYVASS